MFFLGNRKKISKARLNEEKDNGTVHMRCIEVTEAIMQGAREDRGTGQEIGEVVDGDVPHRGKKLKERLAWRLPLNLKL